MLALVLALSATPLAVYADEGDGTTQSETSNASEDPGEKDNGNTNEDSEGKDKDETNDGSEAGALKAAATVGIAPQAAGTYVAWIGDVGYTTLKDAVDAAPENKLTEIRLGEGTYTLYTEDATQKAKVRYKNLTFVGAGRDKTTWLVGPTVPDPQKFGTEYNSDYSFDVRGSDAEPRTPNESETVTFKGMTLQAGKVDYLGFAGSDNTVVEDCTIEGRTAY